MIRKMNENIGEVIELEKKEATEHVPLSDDESDDDSDEETNIEAELKERQKAKA